MVDQLSEDEHADRVWGPGNWMRCVDCTVNAHTHPGVTRHHVDFHKPRGQAPPVDPVGFNPMGGDHRSTVGRFGPLAPDHPGVGKACIICGHKMEAGDLPTLISLAPASVAEAKKKESSKPYNAVAGMAHQSCAWPGSPRT